MDEPGVGDEIVVGLTTTLLKKLPVDLHAQSVTFYVEIQHCGFLPETAAVKICTCNGLNIASFPGLPSFLFFSLHNGVLDDEVQYMYIIWKWTLPLYVHLVSTWHHSREKYSQVFLVFRCMLFRFHVYWMQTEKHKKTREVWEQG